MPPRNTGSQYIDEHHQRISEFAEAYFDDEEEREGFVSELMTRRGYSARTRTEWDPPAPSGGGGQGGDRRQRPPYFKQR
jgi:hypothetical protein